MATSTHTNPCAIDDEFTMVDAEDATPPSVKQEAVDIDDFVASLAPAPSSGPATDKQAAIDTPSVPTPADARVAGAHEARKRMVQLAFALDATQSMQVQIEAAKKAIESITMSMHKEADDYELQVAVVLYRDHPPQDKSWVVKTYAFTADVAALCSWLEVQRAQGGGDGPEAMSTALHEVNQLGWIFTAHDADLAYTEAEREADERAGVTVTANPSAPPTGADGEDKDAGLRDMVAPDSPYAAYSVVRLVVLISDAPPHGIEPSGDGFPEGDPNGCDALKEADTMARRGIVLHTVCVEPGITHYHHATETMHELARRTQGVAVRLADADSLIPLLLGSVKRARQERDVVSRLADKISELATGGIDMETAQAQAVDAIASEIERDGETLTVVDCDTVQGLYVAEFSTSATLGEARYRSLSSAKAEEHAVKQHRADHMAAAYAHASWGHGCRSLGASEETTKPRFRSLGATAPLDERGSDDELPVYRSALSCDVVGAKRDRIASAHTPMRSIAAPPPTPARVVSLSTTTAGRDLLVSLARRASSIVAQ